MLNDASFASFVHRVSLCVLLSSASVALSTTELAAGPRKVISFDSDWRFHRGDEPAAMQASFDDSNWRVVNVPHDWSSEGPFGAEYGSGNGYAPGGIGWYRKHFRLDAVQKDQIVAVEFDGVYDRSEV